MTRNMPYTRTAAAAVMFAAVASVSAACGSSSPNMGPSTGGTCTASSTSTTITISNNAVCPQNITVPRGTQVTFVNSDSRTHEMASDPHPEHTDCTEINAVGNLVPGQSRQTSNLVVARRCGFHDHLAFEVAALKGSITIQ
jgi:plastocyanin